jgi:hypothetical protein
MIINLLLQQLSCDNFLPGKIYSSVLKPVAYVALVRDAADVVRSTVSFWIVRCKENRRACSK